MSQLVDDGHGIPRTVTDPDDRVPTVVGDVGGREGGTSRPSVDLGGDRCVGELLLPPQLGHRCVHEPLDVGEAPEPPAAIGKGVGLCRVHRVLEAVIVTIHVVHRSLSYAAASDDLRPRRG